MDIHEDMLALLEKLRASGTEFRTLSRGDTLDFPSGGLTVLWPEKGRTRSGQNANNYSLVSRLDLCGVVMLHAADLYGPYEHYIAVPADLLRAAHHGSSSSTAAEFLSEVEPQVILLSCNTLARHVSFSERAGDIPVYSTAAGGALTVRFSDGAFTVIPFLSQSQTGGS